ncbi:MAG: DNA-processing protein DprA [Povalibacter sp.]
MEELTAWLTLARVPGFHGCDLSALLEHFPDVSALVSATPAALSEAGANTKFAQALRLPRHDSLGTDLKWLERDHHHLVTWGSADYPPLLAQVADAPLALFVRGNSAVLSMPQLAIVGARNPTASGSETAFEFAEHLASCGLTITSGLANGIDAASHRGALAGNGTTIAVCGTGLDVIYPKANEALAAEIAERGALISEFPLGTPAAKQNFPRRNRVISGLAVGTLVVEAAIQSGSLITARLAADQGREVFAIPGSIHNPLARGCHRLIRQGAKLVETADDIFEELTALIGVLRTPTTAPDLKIAASAQRKVAATKASARPLDKGYEILLDALGFEPTGVDLLVVRTGLRADEVASMLLILELEGHISAHPGGLYVRAHPRQ